MKKQLSPRGYMLVGRPRYWKLNPWEDPARACTLKMQATTGTGSCSHRQVYYKLWKSVDPSDVIFEGDDFGAPSGMDPVSAQAMREVMSFLTLIPGDTDAEYFADYNERQLRWCDEDAEAFGIFCEDPEEKRRERKWMEEHMPE